MKKNENYKHINYGLNKSFSDIQNSQKYIDVLEIIKNPSNGKLIITCLMLK